MEKSNKSIEEKSNKYIVLVSIIIPLAVAALTRFKLKTIGVNVAPFSFLPPIYAAINGITAIILILAVNAIKKGNKNLHERLMKIAIILSILFLLMYVAYHASAEATVYGGEGVLKYIYYFLLPTHIILSIVVIPLVLITYVRALSERFDKHKKIARIAFPIWLYVAITGVIVYLMISPYYV